MAHLTSTTFYLILNVLLEFDEKIPDEPGEFFPCGASKGATRMSTSQLLHHQRLVF